MKNSIINSTLEINIRIQQVRKYLKMSRREFGTVLGVSGDVINNIENNRLKRPELKEPIYKLICEKYGINETWLKTGEGNIFKQPEVKDSEMKIFERIRKLRKDVLHMTQKEFAESIKISRSNLGNIETEKVAVTNRVIYDICEKHNINRDWIVDGIGNIFTDRGNSLDNEVSFREGILKILSEMDKSDWETLEKIYRQIKFKIG